MNILDQILRVSVRYEDEHDMEERWFDPYYDFDTDSQYFIAKNDVEKCISALIKKQFDTSRKQKRLMLIKICMLDHGDDFGLKGVDCGTSWSVHPNGEIVYMSPKIYHTMGEELHYDREMCSRGANGGDYEIQEFIPISDKEYIAEEYKHLFEKK